MGYQNRQNLLKNQQTQAETLREQIEKAKVDIDEAQTKRGDDGRTELLQKHNELLQRQASLKQDLL